MCIGQYTSEGIAVGWFEAQLSPKGSAISAEEPGMFSAFLRCPFQRECSELKTQTFPPPMVVHGHAAYQSVPPVVRKLIPRASLDLPAGVTQ